MSPIELTSYQLGLEMFQHVRSWFPDLEKFNPQRPQSSDIIWPVSTTIVSQMCSMDS